MIMQTERLILRNIELTDVDDIFEYAKNPDVGPNAGWKPHQTKAETLDIVMAVFFEKENIFGIVLKKTVQRIKPG